MHDATARTNNRHQTRPNPRKLPITFFLLETMSAPLAFRRYRSLAAAFARQQKTGQQGACRAGFTVAKAVNAGNRTGRRFPHGTGHARRYTPRVRWFGAAAKREPAGEGSFAESALDPLRAVLRVTRRGGDGDEVHGRVMASGMPSLSPLCSSGRLCDEKCNDLGGPFRT